jgi:hypothetical protein
MRHDIYYIPRVREVQTEGFEDSGRGDPTDRPYKNLGPSNPLGKFDTSRVIFLYFKYAQDFSD